MTLVFVFLTLHEIGAHHTYSEVPYNDWTRALSGTSLNDMLGLQRNYFDRLVQKDMALAGLGAAITMIATFLALRKNPPAWETAVAPR